MQLKSSFSIILILFGVIATSCNVNFQEPELRNIESFKLGRGDGGAYVFDLILKVHNPNKFKLNLNSYDLDVKLNGIDIGKAQSQNKISLSKVSDSQIPVSIKADLSKLAGGFLTLLPALLDKNRPLNVDINGFIKGGAMGISKKLPVSISHKAKLN